jgi:hypothetical protein
MFLEFAFVPAESQAAFKPRKQPLQARSEATVSALFEASVQVLLAVGYRKFTTTRVAERRRFGGQPLPILPQPAGANHRGD